MTRPLTFIAIALSSIGCGALASRHRPAPPAPAVASTVAPAPFVEVAVTVDDLPVHGPPPPDGDRLRMVGHMLDAFHRHAVPHVYGFVNGAKTAGDVALPEIAGAWAVLRSWVAAGHPVGNHTWTHVNLLKVPLPDYLADLEKNEPLLERLHAEAGDQLSGHPWRVFRYPYLFEGDTLQKHHAVRTYLREHGYQIAEVSIDAEDWAFNPPFARCAARGDRQALAQLHDRYVSVHVHELRRMREMTRLLAGREVRHVLLLHAGVADADALDDLLTAYEKEGVRWIDLRTALADPFYAQDPAQPARFGAAFPYLVARARQVSFPPSEMMRDLERSLAAICSDSPAPPVSRPAALTAPPQPPTSHAP